MKRWVVKCQVNLCADKVLTVIVAANTERKAKLLAEKHLYKEGYFAVIIQSCRLATTITNADEIGDITNHDN